MKKLSGIYKICALSLILMGCTSIPADQVNSRMNAWIGLKIDDLIKYWGLPSNQREVDNIQYAEWVNRSSEPGNATVSVGTGHRSRSSSIGLGLTLFDLGGTDDVCSRLVTYDSVGIVTKISWQGTSNYCFKITPDLAPFVKTNR